MGKIMRNDVEYGGGSGGGGDVSQLEQRVERLEDSVDDLDRYKVTQLTFNTGIDIGDWDRVIDPDEPVVYERYTNYHDAVAKLSQQIDIMGKRTDDLKTSLNYIKLGNTDGGNGISLPSGWKEIRVLVARGTSQTYCIPITFTKEEFDNGTRYWQGGFYLSSGNNSCVSVFCNGSSASIGEFYFAGADAKSSCKATWYWK